MLKRPRRGIADQRLQFVPLDAWLGLERRVRVDQKVRRSVVFLGFENERGFVPYGTAFLGIWVYEDMAAPFVITARHVVEDIPGELIAVRMNRKDGTAETKKIAKSTMIAFTDRGIDIAVLPVPLDHSIYDAFPVHLDSAKWHQQIKDAGIGEPSPGDEVSVAGLYTPHYGYSKNMPIIRIGHIAAIPEEKVRTRWGYVRGFLIEIHSIGGLSGSPVFWNIPSVRIVNNELQYVVEGLQHIPIGIFIGYHVIESREDEIFVPQFQSDPAASPETIAEPEGGAEERRTGFGVVLPIGFVFNLFEGEAMRTLLKNSVDKHRREGEFRPASALPAKPAPTSNENPRQGNRVL